MENINRKKESRFHNPFKTETCDSCGASYQAGKPACPRCGRENPHPNRAIPFDESRMMSPGIELSVFLVGWLGFQAIAFFVDFILLLTAKDSEYFSLLLNYISYTVLFCIIIALSCKYLPKLLKTLFAKSALYGLLTFVVIIGFNILWSQLTSFFDTTTNINQNALNAVIAQSPVLALIFTGLIAPFCEEMTYRAGMFTFAKRFNKTIGYVVASVIFGLIHMHDFGSLNEWLNLPPYIFAGLAFAYTYDKYGLGASLVAHCTNNLIAVILSMIA